MLLLMLMLLLLLLLLLPPLHWPLNHPCAAEGVTHAVDMRVLICFCMSATAAAVLLKLGVRCSGSEKLCKCSVYAADNTWEQSPARWRPCNMVCALPTLMLIAAACAAAHLLLSNIGCNLKPHYAHYWLPVVHWAPYCDCICCQQLFPLLNAPRACHALINTI